MVEAIILHLAKSILQKIADFTIDHTLTSVSEEIKAAKSAKKDLKIIADKMEAICAVLEDADKKQYTNKTIKIWLRDIKSLAYDIDDLLDEVSFDALEHRQVNERHSSRRRWLRYYLSSSNPIFTRFHLSHKLKGLREKLEYIVQKKTEFGLTECPVESLREEIRDPFDLCSYVYEAAVIGRDEAKQDIIRKVLAAHSGSDSSQLCVLPIVGMGGIGKTTLAKLVYHDMGDFDLKLWTCVSDRFQIQHVIEDILTNAGCLRTSNQSFETLLTDLQHLLREKKFFLVLDDVWTHDPRTWVDFQDLFKNGVPGCTILITTRDVEVANVTKTMEPYNVDRLPDDVCWNMFRGLAFKEGEEGRYGNLFRIGWSIVQRCCGVPLLVKSLGSLLRSERDEQEWQRIDMMDSFNKLDGQYENVLKVLRVSYDKLPSHLKPLFAYMSLYMKDTKHTINIQYTWSALGLLRLQNENNEFHNCAYGYLKELASRSLIQEPSFELRPIAFYFKVHDLLHDLSASILGEELAIVTSKELKKVSISTKHIVWGAETDVSFSYEEFPRELLEARSTRTFRFGYTTNQQISQSFLERIISHFSCMRYLSLEDSLFEELPSSIGNLKHLRYLNLSHNRIMKSLSNTICKLLNLETLLLEGCDQLKELPRDVHHLQGLTLLTMTTKMVSLVSTKFSELCSLRCLMIDSCRKLVSLWDNGNVGRLTSLQTLVIKSCPELTCLPDSMN